MSKMVFAILSIVVLSSVVSCGTPAPDRSTDRAMKSSEKTDKPKKQIPSHANMEDRNSWGYIDAVADEFIGTYLPEAFIDGFLRTKSYAKAMNIQEKRSYHDILAVNKNIIYGNEKFHDQYALDGAEVATYRFNAVEGRMTITDDKGNLYVKISDSPDYYRETNNFLLRIVTASIRLTNTDRVRIVDGSIVYGNRAYSLVLDAYPIPPEDDYMIVGTGKEPRELIGVQIAPEKLILYRLAAPDDGFRYKNDTVAAQLDYRLTE